MSDVDHFEGVCVGCGAGMSRDVPTAVKGPMADRWRNAPFWCDECAAGEEEKRLAQHAKESMDARLKASGLPSSRHRLIDDLSHPEPVLSACRAWATGEIQGLMLTGPVGTGKTTLAGAAVFEMLAHRQVLWAPLGTFFARLALPFGEPGRQWATSVIDGDQALALDDLDKARNTEYGREQVFTAIDHRIEEGLPLVITSNMGPREISERFGSAVGSRIAGCCVLVSVTGDDRRLAGGAA